jgi:hypothetical protein
MEEHHGGLDFWGAVVYAWHGSRNRLLPECQRAGRVMSLCVFGPSPWEPVLHDTIQSPTDAC